MIAKYILFCIGIKLGFNNVAMSQPFSDSGECFLNSASFTDNDISSSSPINVDLSRDQYSYSVFTDGSLSKSYTFSAEPNSDSCIFLLSNDLDVTKIDEFKQINKNIYKEDNENISYSFILVSQKNKEDLYNSLSELYDDLSMSYTQKDSEKNMILQKNNAKIYTITLFPQLNNNTQLKSISILNDNISLYPSFNPNIRHYNILLPLSVNNIQILIKRVNPLNEIKMITGSTSLVKDEYEFKELKKNIELNNDRNQINNKDNNKNIVSINEENDNDEIEDDDAALINLSVDPGYKKKYFFDVLSGTGVSSNSYQIELFRQSCPKSEPYIDTITDTCVKDCGIERYANSQTNNLCLSCSVENCLDCPNGICRICKKNFYLTTLNKNSDNLVCSPSTNLRLNHSIWNLARYNNEEKEIIGMAIIFSCFIISTILIVFSIKNFEKNKARTVFWDNQEQKLKLECTLMDDDYHQTEMIHFSNVNNHDTNAREFNKDDENNDEGKTTNPYFVEPPKLPYNGVRYLGSNQKMKIVSKNDIDNEKVETSYTALNDSSMDLD